VKLWDLQGRREMSGASLGEEIRACLFLLDAASLVVATSSGRLGLYQLPNLEPISTIQTGQAIQCAELAPSGALLTLGGSDGRVRFVAVEGFDSGPLAVTARRSQLEPPGLLRRLLGRRKPTLAYHCTCPACREPVELSATAPAEPTPCPNCRRSVRACLVTQAAAPVPS
jgi:hypothetical protein